MYYYLQALLDILKTEESKYVEEVQTDSSNCYVYTTAISLSFFINTITDKVHDFLSTVDIINKHLITNKLSTSTGKSHTNRYNDITN